MKNNPTNARFVRFQLQKTGRFFIDLKKQTGEFCDLAHLARRYPIDLKDPMHRMNIHE